MSKVKLSTLEDVVLGLFTESRAIHAGAVLLLNDIDQSWKTLQLRDADLLRGVSALLESGTCRLIPTEDGEGLQLTVLGSDYMKSNALLGLKVVATRRTLVWTVERMRNGSKRRRRETSPGVERRQLEALG